MKWILKYKLGQIYTISEFGLEKKGFRSLKYLLKAKVTLTFMSLEYIIV